MGFTILHLEIVPKTRFFKGKQKFCHHLLFLNLFQVSFFRWTQKKIFLKIVDNRQLVVAIDFDYKNTMEVSGYCHLFG